MKNQIVNQDLLPHNDCFGCGIENPEGLHLEIVRDGNRERLVSIFHPDSSKSGFPGITHGGIIYTVLDCLAAWVPTALRSEIKAIWILRSATMTYHKAAKIGEEMRLSGIIEKEGKAWEPMIVHAEARNVRDELLAEGKFKVIPLSSEKFKQVAGIKNLPANWDQFLKE